MQYLLMLYTKESDWAGLSPAQQEERRVPYMAYMEALKKAGAFLGANRLTPTANGRNVRIDVPDLDAALSWAARCPSASHGAVEVRPVWPLPGSC
jgi:hypothetical protein